ncbi:MAG TPA: TylF/MycF/NovP-related O-methyltransferase [Fimbriimonadaceae bacterium]|nr:TylF/MycF/NovP-related O-methyltransferase [Fimbriimonadaceae bacterium]
MGRFARNIGRFFGYEVERIGRQLPYHGYDLEVEAREAIERIADHTMVSFEKLVPLYQQVAFCEKASIPGCYVECGVWKGGCVGLMALCNLKYGTERRHLHLFDSFEGIPEPDARVDGKEAVRFAQAVGADATGQLKPLPDQYGGIGTVEVCRDLLNNLGYPASHVHIHKGWFQDTLPLDTPTLGHIALLRLDGDWYASTKVCLEHLYDHVVSGGFVIADDYGAYEGCKLAVDEFLRDKSPAYLHHLDRWGRYWIKP